MQQVNAMSATLRAQRLGALEATALLRKVMDEIDVAIFAFDGGRRLKLVNRAGERLVGKPSVRISGLAAGELGLAEFLEGEEARTVQRTFAGGTGRWGVRRSQFREGGLPHQLLVIADLTRPLREEELEAWQRLVRVLGHELNNSLTPIKSIAGSLERLIAREPKPGDWREDMQRGLEIIVARSEALGRFMSAYARLAKLPRPAFAPLSVAAWVERVASLETRVRPAIDPGPDLTVQGDADQLEQLLINLLRNAVDASLETHGGVRLAWRRAGAQLEVTAADEGPGLANTSNLFVPFFTTKPGGSGIGLVLCRQIAEAHGGALTLKTAKTENRKTENRDRNTMPLCPTTTCATYPPGPLCAVSQLDGQTGSFPGPRKSTQSAVVIVEEDALPVVSMPGDMVRLSDDNHSGVVWYLLPVVVLRSELSREKWGIVFLSRLVGYPVTGYLGYPVTRLPVTS
jgi:nitrogen fixation/metabolism regulation signal transduction histidine kinase